MKSIHILMAAMASVVPFVGCGGEEVNPDPDLASAEEPIEATNGYQSQDFTILESDYDVATNVQIAPRSRVTVNCEGSIWAGVWFTGWNGPAGWTSYTAGSDSPLPGKPPFGALIRLNGRYQYVGAGKTFEYYDSKSTLYFRINDNKPGNGDGSFTCRFEVTRF